jgi:hypothetical protein
MIRAAPRPNGSLRASGKAGRRPFGWIAAGAAAALAGAWLATGGPSTLRSLVESPETGIRRALSSVRPPPLAIPATGATLRLDRVKFADLLVTPVASRTEVVAVVDADGGVAWRGEEVRLSYVGRERLAMVRCPDAGWCVDGKLLPRLLPLLALLVRRAEAFADAEPERYGALVADGYRGPDGGKGELLRRLSADLAASPRARLRPLAWQVRIERDTSQVGEDYEIAVGSGAARRLRARFDLRDDGGGWRITGGL